MKNILILLLAIMPFCIQAQFVVGTQGMTIKNGALVSIDSLVLQPSVDFTLNSISLQRNVNNQPAATLGNTIDRVYLFSSPVIFSGTLGFNYRDAEMAGNTEATLSIVYASVAIGNIWITTSGNLLNINTNSINTELSNVTLSRISALSNNNPLPVTILDFVVRKDETEQKALLFWDIADEKNLDRYEITRSQDGINFVYLGSVQVFDKSRYSFIDEHPKVGMNYYRIKLVDIDADYTYSPVRPLLFAAKEIVVNIYPNPVRDEAIIIHTTDENLIGMHGQVMDIAGRIVTSFRLLELQTTLATTQWVSGTYIIRLENGSTFKIVKQQY